ncbi:MFS transporter [Streptomyces albus subsp. chlorinus]|uniref:MFS transporter n=1 Tax=Streptomyces albus TaxID=1888 RepID=UPI00156DF31B|nr:MFS transporter [Streptomyces albus]NSC20806.1 MFS transporter [Streptomyces albus subsp. chlorinus]
MAHDATGKAGPREWAGLVVLTLPVLLIAVDLTVLGFAVPALSEDLAPSSTQLLWLVDIYSFVLAGLLVTMGTVGDRIGRRKLLMAGCAGFGLASALAAYAPSAAALIGARVLLGVAGATLMPSTLSLLRGMFRDERQRLVAVAAWGSAFSAGSALGPVVGGLLLEHFWWGSVFLINLPLVVLALIGLPLLVPETKDPAPGRFDLPSAALTLLTVLPVVYAIKSFAHGDELLSLPFLVAGLAFGAVFVRRQRTLADPLIDITLFRIRRFSAAIVTNVLTVFVMAGSLFFIPQFLQLSEGLSPLRGGLLLLPGAALSVASGFFAAAAARRTGARQLISAGLATAALGFAAMTAVPLGHGVAVVVLAFCLVSLGVGTVMTLTNDMVLSTVPPERAGAASAVSETGIELGGALGVAVLGSVLSSAYRMGLDPVAGVPARALEAARETLGAALATAARLGDGAGRALMTEARDAFADGIRATGLAGALLLAVAAALAWMLLRPRPGQDTGDRDRHGAAGDRDRCGAAGDRGRCEERRGEAGVSPHA